MRLMPGADEAIDNGDETRAGSGSRSRSRARRRRSVLRGIPIAVVTTVIVVAVFARRCRAPLPPPVLPPEPTHVLVDASPASTSPFRLPLLGPTPPPKAEVPAFAPR